MGGWAIVTQYTFYIEQTYPCPNDWWPHFSEFWLPAGFWFWLARWLGMTQTSIFQRYLILISSKHRGWSIVSSGCWVHLEIFNENNWQQQLKPKASYSMQATNWVPSRLSPSHQSFHPPSIKDCPKLPPNIKSSSIIGAITTTTTTIKYAQCCQGVKDGFP